MAKEFYPEFDREDLIAHDKYHIYLKLAIEGKTCQPFSALTLPSFYNFQPQDNTNQIILFSQASYSIKRKDGEEEIDKAKGQGEKGQKALFW